MGLFKTVFGGNEKPTQHSEYEAWQTFYNGLPVNENNEYVMTSEEEEQAALLTAKLLNPAPDGGVFCLRCQTTHDGGQC